MQADLIRSWLDDNGNFQSGLAMLREVNPKAFRQFASWEKKPVIPAEVKQKLRVALTPYAAPADVPGTVAKVKKPAAEEPEAVRRLRQEGVMKLKEYSDMKTRLAMMVQGFSRYSDEDRYEIASLMMEDLLPQIDAIYDKIRSYDESGILPSMSDSEIVQSTVRKMLKIQSLRPAISRLQKRLQEETDLVEKRKLELSLDEKRLELKQIEDELGLSDG